MSKESLLIDILRMELLQYEVKQEELLYLHQNLLGHSQAFPQNHGIYIPFQIL